MTRAALKLPDYFAYRHSVQLSATQCNSVRISANLHNRFILRNLRRFRRKRRLHVLRLDRFLINRSQVRILFGVLLLTSIL